MEKIKAKPIEIFKNIIIALLTLTMLILAGIYIGGSQFVSNNAAIVAADMPDGAVAVGNDAPQNSALYEKNLLAISYAAISYAGGGGAYGCEQAARDLFEFASAPIHNLLSANAKISETNKEAFENAISRSRYIFISLAKPLPYQVLYALTGEYGTAAGSDSAISVDTLLLAFATDGKPALYIKDGERYFLSSSDYRVNAAELAAMASDTRLSDYTISANAVAVSTASPHTQTLSLSSGRAPSGKAYTELLELLGYSASDVQPAMLDVNVVAPHGTVAFTDEKLVYTASKDSGLSLSGFLDNTKNTLDISFYDVLLASVSLVEKLRAAYPEMTGGGLSVYLDGFYHGDDTYTVVFGLSDSSVAISGNAFPYLARLNVSGGRFKSIELNFIGAERSGKTASPFPSAWEYAYASKTNNISAFSLCYKADTLPVGELDARWYFKPMGVEPVLPSA